MTATHDEVLAVSRADLLGIKQMERTCTPHAGERSVHSRTPVLLSFQVTLPWHEDGGESVAESRTARIARLEPISGAAPSTRLRAARLRP